MRKQRKAAVVKAKATKAKAAPKKAAKPAAKSKAAKAKPVAKPVRKAKLPAKVPLKTKGRTKVTPIESAPLPPHDLEFNEFKPHPLAEVFPLISGDEFDALVEDIRVNGLQHPIILHEGLILDGRNRYRACRAANVALRFEVFAGADPVAFVVSTNLRRRDLNASQRAFAISELEKFGHGGNRRGAAEGAKTRKQMAGEGNVSERLVASGAVVRDHGAEPLKAAVRSGALPVEKAAQLALLPEDQQSDIVARGEKEIVAKAKEIRAEKSRKRHAERIGKMGRIAANNGPLPANKYAVIYADPPWKFETWGEATGAERGPAYPTMTLDEICDLDIGSLVAAPAILFVWVTRQFLFQAPARIAHAWGPIIAHDPEYGAIRQPWTYRYDYVWDKVDFGMGYGNRDQHEFLLVFTLGDVPMPLPELRVGSVFREKRGEHSAKPAYFRDLINSQYGTLPKIELFARDAAPGWDVFGNQAPAESVEAAEVYLFRQFYIMDGKLRADLHPDFAGDNFRPVMAESVMTDIDRRLVIKRQPGPLLAALEGGQALPDAWLEYLAELKLLRGRKVPKLTAGGRNVLVDWQEAEKRNGELRELPDDVDQLVILYRETLKQRHDSITEGYLTSEVLLSYRLDLLEIKANGGHHFGMACDDLPAERLRRETAAEPGEEPLWGQIGVFRLDIDGTPYIVSHDEHMHFSIYAEDPQKPFASETGFQSFLGDGPAFGNNVADQAEVYIREVIATHSGSDGKRRPHTKKTAMQLPEHVYRIPEAWAPDEFGRPLSITVADVADAPAAGVDGDTDGIPAFILKSKSADRAAEEEAGA